MDPADRQLEGELARLCLACGLCCDGSLFGRARLEPFEVDRVRRRLAVVESGASFEQPCAALSEQDAARACSIYDDRPQTCRRFECVLFAEHRREGGALEARLAVVRRARELLRAPDPHDYAELAAIMMSFERA